MRHLILDVAMYPMDLMFSFQDHVARKLDFGGLADFAFTVLLLPGYVTAILICYALWTLIVVCAAIIAPLYIVGLIVRYFYRLFTKRKTIHHAPAN